MYTYINTVLNITPAECTLSLSCTIKVLPVAVDQKRVGLKVGTIQKLRELMIQSSPVSPYSNSPLAYIIITWRKNTIQRKQVQCHVTRSRGSINPPVLSDKLRMRMHRDIRNVKTR